MLSAVNGIVSHNPVIRLGTEILALWLLLLCSAHGAELVTDEAMRLGVLRLVFPKATISISPARSNPPEGRFSGELEPLSGSFQDAFADEQEYDVVAPPDEQEEPAASITLDRSSDERRVRLLLYRWRPADGGQASLVAVLHYVFVDANPSRCCRALGKVMLLSASGERVEAKVTEMPNAFTRFTSVRFLDPGRPNPEDLLVSVDFSGAGVVGVNTAILGLTNQRITPLGWLTTAVYDGLEKENEEMYVMTLDEQKTRLSKGKRFWFVKKSYIEKGKKLPAPITSATSVLGTRMGVPLNWN